MIVLERVEQLRDKGKSSDEIERLLLDGKLGKIRTEPDGYQYIENIQLSWLVVEAHEPGHVEWMWTHPFEKVVHHIDGNPLNNVYLNLRIMSRSDHASLHRNDPKFAETERVRNEKLSKLTKAYYTNPDNTKNEKARREKISKSVTAYHNDSANDKDFDTAMKKSSETQRKNNGWVTPESDPEFFRNWFTVKDYAIVSNISLATSYERLCSLLRNKEITCRKKLIDGKRCNIYRRER